MRQFLSIFLIVLLTALAQAQQVPAATPVDVAQSPMPKSSALVAEATVAPKFVLEDATPIRLRLSRNLSSADAKTGDTIDFETLEEIKIGDVLVIPKGSTAWGTVTDAEHKKRMARGGKLDLTIDNVRLLDGEKAALRGVKETKGGGHTGAMTGAIVATAIVVWPAAPFFLFMHGKDITIPKGTEITAYINGNVPLDSTKFTPQARPAGATLTAVTVQPSEASQTTVDVSSIPLGADIELDGSFVGSTPSSFGVPPGEHTIRLVKSGYAAWERKLKTTTGTVKLSPELEAIAAASGK